DEVGAVAPEIGNARAVAMEDAFRVARRGQLRARGHRIELVLVAVEELTGLHGVLGRSALERVDVRRGVVVLDPGLGDAVAEAEVLLLVVPLVRVDPADLSESSLHT